MTFQVLNPEFEETLGQSKHMTFMQGLLNSLAAAWRVWRDVEFVQRATDEFDKLFVLYHLIESRDGADPL